MRYFCTFLKANVQVWMSSRILDLTFSLLVACTISLSSSMNDLVATSSWIGAPQFFTTDSRTCTRDEQENKENT